MDDFKLAGPSANLKQGWSLIRKGIRTEDPTSAGKFLGCAHIVREIRIPNGSLPDVACEGGVLKTPVSANAALQPVRTMMDDIADFF